MKMASLWFSTLCALCLTASAFTPTPVHTGIPSLVTRSAIPTPSSIIGAPQCSSGLTMMAKKKKTKQKTRGPALAARKELDAEMIYFEGRPSPAELIAPTLSIITIIGILPFASSVYRQLTVQYKFTNKRLRIASGFQGQEVIEAPWRDVVEVRYLKRAGGLCGDIVCFLKDGSKLEIRSIPEWDQNLPFIMTMVGKESREASGYTLPEDFVIEYPGEVVQERLMSIPEDAKLTGVVGGEGEKETTTA